MNLAPYVNPDYVHIGCVVSRDCRAVTVLQSGSRDRTSSGSPPSHPFPTPFTFNQHQRCWLLITRIRCRCRDCCFCSRWWRWRSIWMISCFWRRVEQLYLRATSRTDIKYSAIGGHQKSGDDASSAGKGVITHGDRHLDKTYSHSSVGPKGMSWVPFFQQPAGGGQSVADGRRVSSKRVNEGGQNCWTKWSFTERARIRYYARKPGAMIIC